MKTLVRLFLSGAPILIAAGAGVGAAAMLAQWEPWGVPIMLAIAGIGISILLGWVMETDRKDGEPTDDRA